MEQKYMIGSTTTIPRIAVMEALPPSTKSQCQFDIIDQYYKIMLSTANANEKLLEVIAMIKKKNIPNNKSLLEQLLTIKKNLREVQLVADKNEEKLKQLHPNALQYDMIAQLYGRYKEKMYRRLTLIKKYGRYLPQYIKKSQILYSLPEEKNQDIKHLLKLIAYIQAENKNTYEDLITYLLNENILVSMQEFNTLGIQKPREELIQTIQIPAEQMVHRKKSKRNLKIRAKEEMPRIFIYDKQKQEKKNKTICQGLFAKQGQMRPVSNRDLQQNSREQNANRRGRNHNRAHLDKITIKVCKVENNLNIPNREQIISRASSIHISNSRCVTPSDENLIPIESMTVIGFKSTKNIQFEQNKKINQGTQAQNPNFKTLKVPTITKNNILKKTNRSTLTMKKPEFAINGLLQEPLKPFIGKISHNQIKQNGRLKKILYTTKSSFNEKWNHNLEKDHIVQTINKQLDNNVNQSRSDIYSSSESITNFLGISRKPSCNLSKAGTQSRIFHNQEEIGLNFGSFCSKNASDSMVSSTKYLNQHSSHHLIFKPSNKCNFRRKTILKTLPTLYNQTYRCFKNQMNSSLQQHSITSRFRPNFILESKTLKTQRPLNRQFTVDIEGEELMLMSKIQNYNTIDEGISHGQRWFQNLKNRFSVEDDRKFANRRYNIYEVYSPRVMEIISKN